MTYKFKTHTKKIAIMLLSCIMILVLSSCQDKNVEKEPEKEPDYPVRVGNVVISEAPTRVATLSPSMTDTLVSLGFGGRLTAVADKSHIYLEDAELFEYGNTGNVLMPNLSQIKKAAPQIVFSSAPITESNLRELQQMNITYVEIPYAETLEDIFVNYKTIFKIMHGNTTGGEMAEEFIEFCQNYLDDLQNIAIDYSTNANAVYMRMPLLTLATGDTFEQSLFEYMGLLNLAEPYSNWSYPSDKAVELEPEVLLYSKEIDRSTIANASMYKTTACVKNNMLIPVDSFAFENQSVRMFFEMLKVNKFLYPEAYIVEE